MCKFIKNIACNAYLGSILQEFILDALKTSSNFDMMAQRALIAKYLEGGELQEFSREDFVQYVVNYGRTLAYQDMANLTIKARKDFEEGNT